MRLENCHWPELRISDPKDLKVVINVMLKALSPVLHDPPGMRKRYDLAKKAVPLIQFCKIPEVFTFAQAEYGVT
jgi:hypothetical protein